VAALAEAAVLAARRSQAAHLAVLVHGVGHPVHLRVIADRLVLRVHHDHFVVFVSGVLVHPVRVQHPQVAGAAANALLRRGLHVAVELQLLDTSVARLTEHHAFVHRLLAAAAADSYAVNAEAFLGLVTKTVCFVRALAKQEGMRVDKHNSMDVESTKRLRLKSRVQ